MAHSKVREYWLRRGPRLLIVLFLTIIITILMAEFITKQSKNNHIASIIISINLILYNFYMLYQRLIDSIAGAMMRIGHDHYIQWKSNVTYELLSQISII